MRSTTATPGEYTHPHLFFPITLLWSKLIGSCQCRFDFHIGEKGEKSRQYITTIKGTNAAKGSVHR